MIGNASSNINTFQSLFKGREDVFAVRWEKGNKSGYMPAYQYDPYDYRAHKMNGGTFQNYQHKTYLPFTDSQVQKHLDGIQQIGVYPLLQDNTSWFLVADFDKKNWKEEAVQFLISCKAKSLNAYLERSRSGNGGHVWIFFDKPYPAIKSRKIFISILEQSGAFSMFDKSSSFDRLFPNQDFLSGKGLGNLIALPFFKPAFEKGNSCFLNPETFECIADQWDFLNRIHRVPITYLDELFRELSLGNEDIPQVKNDGKLTILLSNNVRISRLGLTTPLINFIKEELNFANTEFFIKKQSGKSTFGTERYFKLVEETANEIIMPRGFIGKLIRFCKEANIEHDFIDNRKQGVFIPYSFNASLRSHQLQTIEIVNKKDFGVLFPHRVLGKLYLG